MASASRRKRSSRVLETPVVSRKAGGVLLSTAVGIVALSTAENTKNIVTGVLIISFTVTAAGCGLLALVFAGRKARLARQQSDFIANISHELRTPLSAIHLYTQTLQSGKLADNPKETARCIDTILRETAWLDVTIDRILTWRSSSKSMMMLNLKAQTVEDAVCTAIERFNSMVPPNEVALSTSIKTTYRVLHDTKAMNTVILNLLTNAYRYSGDLKDIFVIVRDSDNHVVIEVKDKGNGMTSEDAKQIFKPFYRAEPRDGDERGGVGLGLAIVRHLVIQQKGTISVSSKVNEGTTFTISLPAIEPD